jgi:hypothetical protein
MIVKIGEISQTVIEALKIDITPGTSILIGDTNIAHMKLKHGADYDKYGDQIHEIITDPDYVGINPSDTSLEFVKKIGTDEDYVKVAVRISSQGKHFARSLYVLNTNRTQDFIAKGALKPLTK